MSALLRLADAIDWVQLRLGRALKWLAVLLVLNQFLVVVMRYVYGTSFIAMQEAVIYLHATLFMLAIAYAYLLDAHVRVDVFYAGWSVRAQALMDLVGVVVCVLPFCWLVAWASWNWVAVSWRMNEGPMAVGGLPFTSALKTLVPLMAILLAVQGVSVAIRAIAVLARRTHTLFPHKPAQPVDA
jgi:TRAP-type mannitol/chloroaromatic compound transport system permease small subunit